MKDKAGNTISDYTGKITYSVATDVDGLAMVDNENSSDIMVDTKKEGTATITASFAGDDKYLPSTASYTIEVKDPNAQETIEFSGDKKSFDAISNIGGSGYKNGTVDFDATDDKYTFDITDCMLSSDNLQMKATSGKITSPKFGFAYGYTATVVYKSSTDMTITAGGKTATGSDGTATITTTGDVEFVLTTGNKYATVSKITITSNPAPKTESLTTSAKGYATYAADYAVNYSELGLTAYTVSVDETKGTATAKVFTGVVPAGKAVLVKGDAAKTYTLTPATADADDTFTTDLQTSTTSVTADGTQYIFTSKGDTPAFVQATANTTIAAKKGYLVLTDEAAAKLSLSFGGEATGIKAVEAAASARQPLYNVAGQRVATGYKGIVIVNGKKYLNK